MSCTICECYTQSTIQIRCPDKPRVGETWGMYVADGKHCILSHALNRLEGLRWRSLVVIDLFLVQQT